MEGFPSPDAKMMMEAMDGDDGQKSELSPIARPQSESESEWYLEKDQLIDFDY